MMNGLETSGPSLETAVRAVSPIPEGAAGGCELEDDGVQLEFERRGPGREESHGGEHGSGLRQPASPPGLCDSGQVTRPLWAPVLPL